MNKRTLGYFFVRLGWRQRRVLFGFNADRSNCASEQKHRRKLLLVSVTQFFLQTIIFFLFFFIRVIHALAFHPTGTRDESFKFCFQFLSVIYLFIKSVGTQQTWLECVSNNRRYRSNSRPKLLLLFAVGVLTS